MTLNILELYYFINGKKLCNESIKIPSDISWYARYAAMGLKRDKRMPFESRLQQRSYD